MKQLILIRYGELGLKGKNKNQFINRLVENIEHACCDMAGFSVRSTWGRIWVEVDTAAYSQTVDRLRRVFGIYSMSPVLSVPRELSAIQQAAYDILCQCLPQGGAFKVETRRADKTFPMTSPEISRAVANDLFRRLDQRYWADMHNPPFTLQIEIRGEGNFVYGETIPGAGGLPVGCGGKAALMLSGGIDSPVAGWMALKRGVSVQGIHFYSFPFTGEQSKQKVLELAHILAAWQGAPFTLHVVYFTEIQKAIHQYCREDYGITLMRRMMFRLAERIAKQNRCLAIYTGESVGQVASQTLESMSVINEVTNMPILRPLIGMDKEEIMAIAKKIGTFDTSILPYEDCCTIFLPKYPKIRPRLDEAKQMEDALDIEALLAEALDKTETLIIE